MVNSQEKKRFFRDDLESSQDSSAVDINLDQESSILFTNAQNANSQEIEVEATISQNQVLEDLIEIDSRMSLKSFKSNIEQIIPDIDQGVLSTLYEIFGSSPDPVRNAIDSYFSDSACTKSSLEKAQPERFPKVTSKNNSIRMMSQRPSLRRKMEQTIESPKIKKSKSTYEWKRFVGALQINAMATRPILKPLPYGKKFKLVRSDASKVNSVASDYSHNKKVSFSSHVKIYDEESNRELGKVSEDIARILFPLVEEDSIVFKIILIYCEQKRLSIGDPFFLQLDCFLTSALFKDDEIERSFQNNQSEFYSQAIVENQNEMNVKLRRNAFTSLFKKLTLHPILDEEVAIENHRKQRESSQEVIDLNDISIDEKSQDGILIDTSPNPDAQDSELDVNQIKSFYNAVQASDVMKNLEETEPSKSIFNLELRKYQKQGLTWMLKREKENAKAAGEGSTKITELQIKNPLWKQFKWPKDMSWDAQRAENLVAEDDLDDESKLFFYANFHTMKFSIEKPLMKSSLLGGILADEMGLGKTISIYSLILSAPTDCLTAKSSVNKLANMSQTQMADGINQKPYASKTTLIVVPMSLLTQWYEEFNKSNPNPEITCEVYYGGNVSSLKTLLTKTKNPPTVVLTTYGIVQNEYMKLKKSGLSQNTQEITSGLLSVKFFRIVLDEAHTIRNRNTLTSKAVMSLTSSRKWVLTGTPIINRVDDLFSLVKFLNLEPWSQVGFWKSLISTPFEKKNFKEAFEVVNSVLEPILLRRTKQMKDSDGNLLVNLPPKEVTVEKVKLTQQQENVYKLFLNNAEASVKSNLAQGTLLKKYSTILVHILRLRQACCDIKLLGTGDDNDEDIASTNTLLSNSTEIDSIMKDSSLSPSETYFEQEQMSQLASKLKEKFFENGKLKSTECPICTADPILRHEIVFTECCHGFCKTCLVEYIDFQKKKNFEVKCPICREVTNPNKILVIGSHEENNLQLVPFKESTTPAKLIALLKHLRVLQAKSPGEQVVVFSQFSSYLDILESELKFAFPSTESTIYKFDGRLSMKERSAVLKDFSIKSSDTQKILLLSLKAGGVGLNLTCAAHAFMMDPWWSPSMEDQAIDRIHRIGQTNSVKVVRFIAENSIEEKILKIQERKRTLGEAMDTDEDARRKRRIEEIQMLFE